MNIPKHLIQKRREEKAVDVTVQMCFLTAVLVLREEGQGRVRLTRFADAFSRKIKEYRNRYDEVMLDALISHAKSVGIEVDWI